MCIENVVNNREVYVNDRNAPCMYRNVWPSVVAMYTLDEKVNKHA